MKGLVAFLLFCVVLPAILWVAMQGAWDAHYASDPNHAGGGCFEPAYRAQAEPC